MRALAVLADAGLVDLTISDSGHRDWGRRYGPDADWPRPEAAAILWHVRATITSAGTERLARLTPTVRDPSGQSRRAKMLP
jgi:hypothetical protein